MSEDVKVPEGWKRLKLGEIVENLKKVAPPMSKPYLEIGDIDINSKSYKLKDKEAPNYCLVAYKDNIVISKVRPTRGAIAKIKETKIFVSPALLVLKYSNPSFLFYSLSRDAFFNFLGKLETGTTYPSVNDIDILSYEILFPPISTEQQKIAEILETVDNAIEKTEKIIEKYKRIKQGLMQELLTKGIDENGRIRSEKTHKFKDSPIGRIPEEWKVVSIYDSTRIFNGGTPKTDIPEYWNGNIPWLSVEDFNIGKRWISYSSKFITDRGLKNSTTRILKKGMLIISARGTVGVIAQLAKDMAFNQTSYGLDSKNKEILSNDFIYFSLKYYINYFLCLSYGNVFETITRNTFKAIYIALPPLPEQQRIAEILSQIDNTTEKEEAYKQKLEQIKKGLMEDLLTGRVRVNHLIEEEENEK